MDVDEIAPVPTEEAVRTRQEQQEEQAPTVWGMPKWGWDAPEVRPGVRLLEMDKLPALLEQHSMLDVPSTVLFPWLHGICDDGQKGRDMAAFFG
jgi:dual specificity MAP kinase phosphatase